jgi:hypothetical protein
MGDQFVVARDGGPIFSFLPKYPPDPLLPPTSGIAIGITLFAPDFNVTIRISCVVWRLRARSVPRMRLQSTTIAQDQSFARIGDDVGNPYDQVLVALPEPAEVVSLTTGAAYQTFADPAVIPLLRPDVGPCQPMIWVTTADSRPWGGITRQYAGLPAGVGVR